MQDKMSVMKNHHTRDLQQRLALSKKIPNNMCESRPAVRLIVVAAIASKQSSIIWHTRTKILPRANSIAIEKKRPLTSEAIQK